MSFVPVGSSHDFYFSIKHTDSKHLLMKECYIKREDDKQFFFTKISARAVFNCTIFELKYCNLTEDDMYLVAKAIEGNTNLFKIDLSSNRITLCGLGFLTKALMTCSVSILELSSTHIHTDGFKLLCDLLEVNQSIFMMYVDGCDIGEEVLTWSLPCRRRIRGLCLNNGMHYYACDHNSNFYPIVKSYLLDELTWQEAKSRPKKDGTTSVECTHTDQNDGNIVDRALFYGLESVDLSQLSMPTSRFRNIKRLVLRDCNIHSVTTNSV